jgi:hypothetical protein
VSCFLASLAPDIGQTNDANQIAVADRPAPNVPPTYPSSPWSPANAAPRNRATNASQPSNAAVQSLASAPYTVGDGLATSVASNRPSHEATTHLSWQDITNLGWYDPAKSALALVGLIAVTLQLIKKVR